jgi:hypothetical protein
MKKALMYTSATTAFWAVVLYSLIYSEALLVLTAEQVQRVDAGIQQLYMAYMTCKAST